MAKSVVTHRKYGPAMSKLTEKQRAFVDAMLITGGADQSKCALMAGYECTHPKSASVIGTQLAHDENVLAAMREEAQKRIHSGAILASSVLMEVALDPMHKDRLKAATEILNRSGLHAISEHRSIVQHELSDKDMVREIVRAAVAAGRNARAELEKMGIDPNAIEAEFEEIKPKALPAPEEPLPSAVGLEDLL